MKATIAQNLRKLLATRPGNSRMELAERMRVSDGTLGRILYGTGNPTVEVITNIANFFRVEPWELLVPSSTKPDRIREASPIDEGRLAQAVDDLTRILDAENLALPKPLFARATALLYSEMGRDNPRSARTNVLELIRKSS